jgi:NAD(P)-dependent dehydrogenase (short-subunit alcohol dehydrogenase family)
MELRGSVVLVTGGASGLGAATVTALEEAGARPVIADIPETDVTVPADVERLLDAAREVHAVVNCAGVAAADRVLSRRGQIHSLETFEHTVRVNLVGTFNVIRLAVPRLARNAPARDGGERGAIVNTASAAAFDGQAGQSAYAASKAGVLGPTLPLARDLAPLGIRLLAIAPGIMETPMLGSLNASARKSLDAQVCFPKRLGRPSEFAALVMHCLTNEYLNASVIRLDAGLRMAAN